MVPNSQPTFAFFVAKGLSPIAAAAIAGNLEQESGIDPGSLQRASGPGRGIAQWTVNQRWAQLVAYSVSRNRDPWSLNAQLEFVWYELAAVPAFGLTELRAASDLPNAVRAFQNRYERCGVCNEPRRIALAQAVLDKFSTAGTPAAASPLGGFLLKIALPAAILTGGYWYLKKEGFLAPKRA